MKSVWVVYSLGKLGGFIYGHGGQHIRGAYTPQLLIHERMIMMLSMIAICECLSLLDSMHDDRKVSMRYESSPLCDASKLNDFLNDVTQTHWIA
jgi:hypothetical protein